MARRLASKEKKQKQLIMDGYTIHKLKIIMGSGLFGSENEAIRAAIIELAKLVEQGVFEKEDNKND